MINAGSSLHLAAEPSDIKPLAINFPPQSSPALQSALNGATPFLRELTRIHGCINSDAGMLRLNSMSVVGDNFGTYPAAFWSPDGSANVMYHDRAYCVIPESLGNVEMLAANTLKLRVMYVASDSQERVYFGYIIRRNGAGEWRLAKMQAVKNMNDYKNLY